MSRSDPPEVVELFQRIVQLLPRAVAFDGVMVRSASTLYASKENFLSGNGAAKVGGRWNRPGIRAVYASLDIMTATHEAYQNFIDAGFSLLAIRPRVTAGTATKLGLVLDLTDKAIRRMIGYSQRELLEEDWHGIQSAGEESWTQAIGRGCRAAGFEGLIVPSARNPGGTNIVVFPDRLRPGSNLSVLAAADLPPHPDDWLL
jgi:RES domain-containing protein